MPLHTDGLVPLSEATEWKVAEHDPDVRRWKVVGAGAHLVGDVDDLLIDTRAQRARYIVLSLHEDVRAAAGRKVLVPIGVAHLDEQDRCVVVPDLTRADCENLPSYEQDTFSRDHEDAVRACFGTGSCSADDDYYAHDHFDDGRFFGRDRRG